MRHTVFVVEDDDSIRELISIILENDFEVLSFATIAAFERQIYTMKPSVILLDVRLPDGNGIEVCRKIKEDILLKNVPVLLMSAHADLSMSLQQSKAEDFINKPFDVSDLQKKVLRYVA